MMPTATHNHDEEYYAKQILEEYCGFPRGYLYISDRPDIQSKKESIGIEVVQAISEAWHQRERYSQEEVSMLSKEKQKLFASDQKIEFSFGGFARMFTPNNSFEMLQTKKLIREQMEKKISKSENYTKLDSFQLFIFVRECLIFSDNDISEIRGILLPGMKKFPTIYLCSRPHLWTFSGENISYVYMSKHNELLDEAINEEEQEARKKD